jgi:hypothetical protein
MYAIVAAAKVDHPDEARTQLETARVAPVRRAPGLVCAYRPEPLNGIGMSIPVFDAREPAPPGCARSAARAGWYSPGAGQPGRASMSPTSARWATIWWRRDS